MIDVDEVIKVMRLDRGAAYQLIRAVGPVWELGEGEYVLTRRDDILAALRNPNRTAPPLPKNPQHDVFVRLFDRSAVSAMSVVVREQAGEVIQRLVRSLGCEAIADAVLPFMSSVIYGICGLTSDDAVLWLTPEGPDLDCHLDIVDGLIAARRENSGGDVISRMLIEAPELSDKQIGWWLSRVVCQSSMLMAVALGHALLELARNPNLRERLRENPRDCPVFVNEIVRLEGAAVVPRRTVAPLTVGGVSIPVGSLLHLWMGLVDRDGSDEMSTDELRMDGRHCQHSFGVGPRRCAGALFVRTVLAVFIGEWLTHIPDFDVEPDYTPRVHYPYGALFLLRELPLRWET